MGKFVYQVKEYTEKGIFFRSPMKRFHCSWIQRILAKNLGPQL